MSHYGFLPEGLDFVHSSQPFYFEEFWLSSKGCSNIGIVELSKDDIFNPASQVVRKIESYGKA